MTHKRRIAALECIHQKRQQAAAPDLDSLRRFFINLHRAYGPLGEPPPEWLDAELLALKAGLEEELAGPDDFIS